MKNVKVLFVALVVSAFVFASCGEKCLNCTMDIGGVVTELEEVCGTSEEMDAAEAAYEITAAFGGGSVTCDRK